MSAVREATVHDLPMLARHGGEFFAEGGLPGRFDGLVFAQNWRRILESGLGTIFISTADGDLAGALGAIVFPDVNDGLLVGTEMFWFVRMPYRGGLLAARLLAHYEAWAAGRGCARVGMVHLERIMPEKLAHLYERRGYEKTETHYFKTLATGSNDQTGRNGQW